jgi:hypothetical protein
MMTLVLIAALLAANLLFASVWGREAHKRLLPPAHIFYLPRVWNSVRRHLQQGPCLIEKSRPRLQSDLARLAQNESLYNNNPNSSENQFSRQSQQVSDSTFERRNSFHSRDVCLTSKKVEQVDYWLNEVLDQTMMSNMSMIRVGLLTSLLLLAEVVRAEPNVQLSCSADEMCETVRGLFGVKDAGITQGGLYIQIENISQDQFAELVEKVCHEQLSSDLSSHLVFTTNTWYLAKNMVQVIEQRELLNCFRNKPFRIPELPS